MLNRQDRALRVCELDGRFCRTLIRDRIVQPKVAFNLYYGINKIKIGKNSQKYAYLAKLL